MSGAASVYFLGSLTEPRKGFWSRPFSNIGAVSIALNLLMYTFRDMWINNKAESGLTIEGLLSSELLLIIFAVISLLLAYRTKRSDLRPLSITVLFCFGLALIPTTSWQPDLFALAANIVALSLGVWYLWLGVNTNSTSRMNFGLILIMTLILMRFFDQDFSFIVKGIAFIVMGSAFIGVNLWQSRRSGT
jgi:hypothetical protein